MKALIFPHFHHPMCPSDSTRALKTHCFVLTGVRKYRLLLADVACVKSHMITKYGKAHSLLEEERAN